MPTVSYPAEISPTALQAWLEQINEPRLVDVRTPAEFRAGHIPGAYNVPLDLLQEHKNELRHHLDEHVVLICRSGGRASQAEGLLASTGLPNLHVLQGGMLSWERARGEVSRIEGGHWELERQVRLVAGGIVAASVLVSALVPKAKWVAAAIGSGLVGAALTDSCMMGQMLMKLPYNRDGRDLEDVVAELAN